MEKIDLLVKEPTSDIISQINLNKSVILMGKSGTGKTTVIGELFKNDDDSLLKVNGCKTYGNAKYYTEKIFNLHHIALIIKECLDTIEDIYPDIYHKYFSLLNGAINSILQDCMWALMTNNYKLEEGSLTKNIYNNPEELIEMFLEYVGYHLPIDKILFIVDNFDHDSVTTRRYQKLIYEKIRNYFSVIVTVSDESVINNKHKAKKLEKDNQVIKMNYSKELEVVKEILDKTIMSMMIYDNNYNFNYRIRHILSDEVINKMIIMTNGDLFEMQIAIRALYENLSKLNINDYGIFVLNYIKDDIKNRNIISNIYTPKRVLHI